MYLYSTLDDEHFQLLDTYICISSHYRQLYSRNILCSCLKQPQLYNNSPFKYIAHVDGSFVNISFFTRYMLLYLCLQLFPTQTESL